MRIYTGGNDALDFCKRCYPKTEEQAFARYGAGEGPDNRGNCFGYDCEHPDYVGTGYRCHGCGSLLTSRDN